MASLASDTGEGDLAIDALAGGLVAGSGISASLLRSLDWSSSMLVEDEGGLAEGLMGVAGSSVLVANR